MKAEQRVARLASMCLAIAVTLASGGGAQIAPNLPAIVGVSAAAVDGLQPKPSDAAKSESAPAKTGVSAIIPVWGKEVGGLQSRLSFELSPRPYRQGENIPLLLHVRNISQGQVTVKYSRIPGFIDWSNQNQPLGLRLTNARGEALGPLVRNISYWGMGAEPESRVIKAGETATLGRMLVPIRPPDWQGNLTVNVRAFGLVAGSYQLTAAATVVSQLAGQPDEVLTTGSLALEVVTGDGPAPREGPALAPWGEAVDGLQCRAALDRVVVPEGQLPRILIDMRNHGTRSLEVERPGMAGRIEIDGQVLRWAQGWSGPGMTSWLKPGEEVINYTVVIPSAAQQRDNAGLRPAPGKHTMTVITTARDVDGGKPITIKAVPMEFEVRADPAAPGIRP